MIYLPDTNAFSVYLSGRSPALAKRMTEAVAAGEVRLSFMVLAELQFGAEKARRELGHTRVVKKVESLRDLLDVEPLGAAVASVYARVRCQLEGAGMRIGDEWRLIKPHSFLYEWFATSYIWDGGEEHLAAQALHLAERALHGAPVGDRGVEPLVLLF